MELYGSKIKDFLHFLILQETETPKKIPYISGNGTFLYFTKRKP